MKLVFAIYFHIPCLLRSRQAPTLKGSSALLGGNIGWGVPLGNEPACSRRRAGVAGLLHICAICDIQSTLHELKENKFILYICQSNFTKPNNYF